MAPGDSMVRAGGAWRIAVWLALVPSAALARPGGGEGFHAGSPGVGGGVGGGGGMRGTGGASLAADPDVHPPPSAGPSEPGVATIAPETAPPSEKERFAVGVGLAGVAVLAGFVAVSAVGDAFRPPPKKKPAKAKPARELDPAHRALFVGIYDAWNRQDADALRPFVSDGVFNRFAALLDLQAREGFRNETRVDGLEITTVSTGISGIWERVVLRVDAVGRDRDLALDGGGVRRDVPMRFTEYWTLLRRTGPPPTHPSGCPACGAAAGEGATTRCPSCGSIWNSGLHRPVLAAITQSDSRVRHLRPRSVAALEERLQVSADAVEDRAASAFWTWIAAGATDRPGLLRSYVPEGTAIALEPWTRVAVGGVEVDRIEETPAGLRAEVVVEWTGLDRVGRSRDRLSRLSFAVAHSPAPSLAAFCCGECGGPLDRSDAPDCPWCGSPRRPGAADWAWVAVTHAERS